jgi:serine/threonine protein kinase
MQDSLPPSGSHSSALGRLRRQPGRRQAVHDSGYVFRDRYHILRVLASGGFGITYLAKDQQLPGNPLCVVKQLCPKVRNPMALERAKRRFRQEAKVLAKVGSHSQIPRLLDYFTVNQDFYLVQEFIQGDVLTKEVRRHGVQSETQVKRFLKDLLPVIKFIHRRRIIHRDIKPPNIIRCKQDGRLVLIDFGAVRECLADIGHSGTYHAPLTQFVGTPGFAPPEQQALRPTFASDIYALGITCLFMLTGKTPIEFDTDPASGRVLWQDFVQVSPGFTTLIEKMIQPDSQERYQSADEVMRILALEPYQDSLAMGLSHAPRSEAPPSRETVIPIQGYISPVQRQAAEIRQLRSRQQRRPSSRAKRSRSLMTSSSLRF